jgi:hypothetical protein
MRCAIGIGIILQYCAAFIAANATIESGLARVNAP